MNSAVFDTCIMRGVVPGELGGIRKLFRLIRKRGGKFNMNRGQCFYSQHISLWHHDKDPGQGLWATRVIGAARRVRFLGVWRKNSW